jgi:hypothetical protein
LGEDPLLPPLSPLSPTTTALVASGTYSSVPTSTIPIVVTNLAISTYYHLTKDLSPVAGLHDIYLPSPLSPHLDDSSLPLNCHCSPSMWLTCLAQLPSSLASTPDLA